jgi:flavin-dependent dehydrogenase
MQNKYDVVILGGGLAGLTLSLQLKQANPNISILIIERRSEDAPAAAHKVGESTVELGTHYLREVLNLKDYLDAHQLPKHGLRFFFSPLHKGKIEERVELGPRESLPVPSHQLDRGVFENELMIRTKALGNTLVLSGQVKDVALDPKTGHVVTYIVNGEEFKADAKWVADATGRGSFLKRKLSFQKTMDHIPNAVWFRVKGEVDINGWSEDKAWTDFIKPGLRRLSTVHFMGQGYWLWVIPLVSGNTSIGIVADPRFHPFDEINKYDLALAWIEKHEPLVARKLKPQTDEPMDFKILKHFAHHTGQLYSADRWGVTGESGAFLDAFYSPGTDFIAMNNGWLSDLILRDLRGEDISLHAEIYQKTHMAIVDNWIPVYQDKYQLFGCSQIMVVKIFWDWAIYWSVSALLFTNHGLTNLRVLKDLFSEPTSLGRKFGALNKRMQDLFIAWGPYDTEDFTRRYIDPFDIAFLRKFHHGIEANHTPKDLINQVAMNMTTLENIAAEVYRLVSSHINDTPSDMKVNPYTMSLDFDKAETLRNSQSPNAIAQDPEIAKDVAVMWFYKKKKERA